MTSLPFGSLQQRQRERMILPGGGGLGRGGEGRTEARSIVPADRLLPSPRRSLGAQGLERSARNPANSPARLRCIHRLPAGMMINARINARYSSVWWIRFGISAGASLVASEPDSRAPASRHKTPRKRP